MTLKFWKAAEKFWMDDSGYSHVNMTVPQSFAFSVADSPVGAAAWIIEKYHAWSDWKGRSTTSRASLSTSTRRASSVPSCSINRMLTMYANPF